MKHKWPFITSLVITIVALAVGASFHGYRIHPENIENYNIGVTMGITMASIAAVAFIAFLVFFILYKKNKKIK